MMGLMSALTGVSQGITSERERQAEEVRRANIDRMAMERHQREQAEYMREVELRQGIQSAGGDIAPVSAEVYQPAMDDDGNVMPANPTAGMVRVGNDPRMMTGAEGATAAGKLNAPGAKLGRQADYLGSMGEVSKAEKYREAGDFLKKQGHLKFVEANWGGVPSMEEIRGGKVDFDLNGVDEFNKRGDTRVPEGARGKAFITKDAQGREQVDFRVVGADGEPVVPASALQIETVYGMTAGERRAERARAGDYMEKRADRKEDKDERAKDRDLDREARTAAERARAADRDADNKRQEARDAVDADYKRGMLGVAGQRADNAPGAKTARDRMPEGEKMAFDRALKRRDKAEDRISELQGKDEWDPKKANHRQLQLDADAADAEATVLLRRYAGDGSSAPADPYGARPKAAPGAAPPAGRRDASMSVSPGTQSARDVEAGKQMILAEFGGDLGRARTNLASMEDAIKRAPPGKNSNEAIGMLRTQAAALRAGIDALSGPIRPTNASMATVASPSLPPRSETVGGNKTTTPMQSSPVDIPPPPSPTFSDGKTMNPKFTLWQRTYGRAWEEKLRQEEAAAAAARGVTGAESRALTGFMEGR